MEPVYLIKKIGNKYIHRWKTRVITRATKKIGCDDKIGVVEKNTYFGRGSQEKLTKELTFELSHKAWKRARQQ